jgi:hypothetical protein
VAYDSRLCTASRIQRIRAGLNDDDRPRFDVELHKTIVSAGESGDLRPLDHLIEAWLRAAISYELAGTAWTAVEARLRRGEEPEWGDEPRYRIVQTP